MMAERDDLRLELTMQERARIHEERKLKSIQRDADEGAMNFEKNMTRLGLDGTSTANSSASSLRAIPVTDTGALAHFKKLEERVEELEFRPSNNVKMMKELRARRKAQLAAEKDRRMRRRKSNGHQGLAQPSNLDHDSAKSLESESSSCYPSGTADDAVSSSKRETNILIRNIREEYLESKRAELEANYDQLREIGAVRRELDMQKLDAIRADGYRKADFHKWEVCADAAEALISFAFDCAMLRYAIFHHFRTTARLIACFNNRDLLLYSHFSDAGDPIDMVELKRNTFLCVAATEKRQTGGDKDDDNDETFELKEMVQSFLSRTQVWGEMGCDGNETHSPLSSSSTAIQAFVQDLLAPCPSLNTTWTPTNDFRIVCMFTEDSDSSNEYPRRIAMERGMQYASVDLIVDECVQKSVDQQKQADAAALPLPELEV